MFVSRCLVEGERDVVEKSKGRRKYIQCDEYIGRHQGKTSPLPVKLAQI